MSMDLNNGGSEDPSKNPAPAGKRDELPMIILPSGEMSITEAAESLFKHMAESKAFFVRGGRVMKLKHRDDGVSELDILDPEEARSDFEKFGRLVVCRVGANGEKVWKPTVCPTDTAKALLASKEAKELLPVVSGLINCPVIHEHEGTLAVARVGYDPQTKRLVTAGKNPPEVPSETAVQELLGLLAEFKFHSDSDKARAVASLLTPALKLGGFIKDRVPADVAEADLSQAGKTYRQKIIAAIYNEHVSLVTNRQGGVGSVDESLSQQLVAGRPFIQLDNFRERLKSQCLESFMTAEISFPCRIPHKGQIIIQPENFFIFLTSNGVDTTRDFANRSSIIRIRKQSGGFKFRKYKEGDLLAHVRANQAHYLGCVFAVIRKWHELGKEKTEETRHDFREWAQTLDLIVQKLFGLPPLMDGHEQAQQRVSSPDLVFLRAVALKVEEMKALGVLQKAADIQAICDATPITIPGLPEGSADSERATRVIGNCMGRLFKEGDSIEVDGYRVERRIVKTPRFDGNGSYDSKSYVFTSVSKSVADNTKAEPKPARTVPEIEQVFPMTFREPSGGICVCFQKDPLAGSMLTEKSS
jgi:hypothetical protein